jgi:hypothetical protein
MKARTRQLDALSETSEEHENRADVAQHPGRRRDQADLPGQKCGGRTSTKHRIIMPQKKRKTMSRKRKMK